MKKIKIVAILLLLSFSFSCQKNKETVDLKSNESVVENDINHLQTHLSEIIEINRDSIIYDKNSDSFVIKSLSVIQSRKSVQNMYNFHNTETLKDNIVNEKF